MDEEPRCSACGQAQLFGPVHLYSLTTGSLSGDVFAATLPTTGMVRQQTTVPIAVQVCGACGHLELSPPSRGCLRAGSEPGKCLTDAAALAASRRRPSVMMGHAPARDCCHAV